MLSVPAELVDMLAGHLPARGLNESDPDALVFVSPEGEVMFSPQADVVASLRLSKQMASQLIDTLVVRGYLERRNDPVDRRRMEVRLTARGQTAAITVQGAIDAVEHAVVDLISAEELQGFRAGLAAYRTVRAERDHPHRSP